MALRVGTMTVPLRTNGAGWAGAAGCGPDAYDVELWVEAGGSGRVGGVVTRWRISGPRKGMIIESIYAGRIGSFCDRAS